MIICKDGRITMEGLTSEISADVSTIISAYKDTVIKKLSEQNKKAAEELLQMVICDALNEE